jgi:rubrerythrin
MQATTLGSNLTGAALAPQAMQDMLAAADELSPFTSVDVTDIETRKLQFIAEAEAVGSVPMPPTAKGVLKAGVAKIVGGQPTILIDKLGERLAYERTGTRLYEALILKFRATQEITPEPLSAVVRTNGGGQAQESAAQTLERIRAEELAHFNMLCEAIEKLGGDPTAQTPCADVIAVASSGFMQVLNDPRTTLAQCLNAMLAVELADNAGWELLASLAQGAGQAELAQRFAGALAEEQRHATIIKAWLTEILVQGPKPAVA